MELRARSRGAAVWHAIAGRPGGDRGPPVGGSSMPASPRALDLDQTGATLVVRDAARCGCSSPAPSIRPAARSRSPNPSPSGVKDSTLAGTVARYHQEPASCVPARHPIVRRPGLGCAVFSSNCRAATAPAWVWRFSMKTLSAQPGHAKLSWKWSGSDPDAPRLAAGHQDRSTRSASSTVDADADPIAGAISSICSAPKPCWKRKSTGFDYRRSDGVRLVPDH